MKYNLLANGAIITAITLIGAVAEANAEESASYKLYHVPPDASLSGPADSGNFSLGAGSVTWSAKPLTSANFMIVSEAPQQAAEAETSPSVSVQEEVPVQQSGGSRGQGTYISVKKVTAPEVIPPEPARPAAPTEPEAVPEAVIPLPEDQVPAVEIGFPDLEIADEFARDADLAESYAPSRYFRLVDREQKVRLIQAREGIDPEELVSFAKKQAIYQIALTALQSTAAFAFLLAFFLLLLKVPAEVLKHSMRGSIGYPRRVSAVRKISAGRKKRNKHPKKIILGFLGFIGSLLIPLAMDAATVPQRLAYNGHLLDSNGSAVTSSVSARFSFWTSADYLSADVSATGALNISAVTYAGWNEVFTVTPNSDGYFSVELGSGTVLPDFSSYSNSQLNNLHLQVEVKASGAGNASYELLDVNVSDTVKDRAPLLSVPFALNADLLDGRNTGTASGSIPVLETGGLLPVSTVPGGTNGNMFIIDSDNSVSSGSISLQFGQSLSRILSYEVLNSSFAFNDDVKVGGSLTATGGLTASGTIATESGVVINFENAEIDSVLGFGNSLGQETLKFLNAERLFEFSDDLRITGGLSASGAFAVESDAVIGGALTVGGLINGIDITSLSNDTDVHLKASSGAGLTVSVAEGSYRLGGVVTQFAGTSSVAIADDAATNIFFTSTGLTLTTDGFPNNRMYIPVASVVTSDGAVDSVTDRRVLNNNDTERTTTRTFQPAYEGASYFADGTLNVGQLSVSHSGGNLMNFYKWTSSRNSLNDYDVLIRAQLPDDFVRWGTLPLSVSYRSLSGDSNDNKLDITVFDSDGNSVSLSGDSTDLNSTVWTTTAITFSGNPVWTAGSGALIRLRMYAKDNQEMHVGTVKLQYTELLSED